MRTRHRRLAKTARPFLSALLGRGASTLVLGCDSAWIALLREADATLTICGLDRSAIEQLAAEGLAARTTDFLSALARTPRAALDLVVVAHEFGRMTAAGQRELAAAVAAALKPGGLAIFDHRRDDARTDPRLTLGPFGAAGGFSRGCVVFPDGRIDAAACFIVAQTAGAAVDVARLDEAFARCGFDLAVLDDREARLERRMQALADELERVELTLHSLLDWQTAFATQPAVAPPRRPLLARVAEALARKKVAWSAGFQPALSDEPAGSRRSKAGDAIAQEPAAVRLAYSRLRAASGAPAPPAGERLRLAYVSPAPPQRSGIADYSAHLLPALAAHYDIDLIVEDPTFCDARPDVAAIRDPAWLIAHAADYDRILYQFGNSEFHAFMVPLLREIPGAVFLHDFYLGHLWRSIGVARWREALAVSHGYGAARRLRADGDEAVGMDWPANREIVEQASGVIVSNHFSRTLAERFYPERPSQDWAVVPHMREIPPQPDRAAARAALGLATDAFVVCTFGYLGETKRSDALMAAWRNSPLADDADAHLVFVGAAPDTDYCGETVAEMESWRRASHVAITGFAPRETYEHWLAAADVAVQLRAFSRGESSYAAIDCMAYGLPLVVNAHGAMAELPDDCVVRLADDCTADDLAAAIGRLRADCALRREIGARARAQVATAQTPAAAALAICAALDRFAAAAPTMFDARALSREAHALSSRNADETEWIARARALVRDAAARFATQRILVDVTSLAHHDLRTGIQRVARAQLLALLDSPPPGYRVEPVRLTHENGGWRLRGARRYVGFLLNLGLDERDDEIVAPAAGDVYFMPDLNPASVIGAAESGLFRAMRDAGATIAFEVYDILPLTRPDFFPPGAGGPHRAWLEAIAREADLLVCISQHVAQETARWLDAQGCARRAGQAIRALHLGGDLDASAPSEGETPDAAAVHGAMLARPTFLAVGTIEPRKGHAQMLAAFDLLWDADVDVNLVIVGAEGWRSLEPAQRRTIPKIVARLRAHEELGERLFWLEDASDEAIETLYDRASCLIVASEAEGFGLPLVEAARHKLPILARDIAVFREVAGEGATWFDGMQPDDLAAALRRWLDLHAREKHVRPDALPWLTWAQNGAALKSLLLETAQRTAQP